MKHSFSPKRFIKGLHELVLNRKDRDSDVACMAAFVSAMNAKSAEIGLDAQTVWMNPSGREDNGMSFSTAKSLAIMTAFASGYPRLCEVWNKASHVVKRKGKKDRIISSSVFTDNILVNSYPILGGKTGSGFNIERTKEYETLVAIAELDGKMVAGAIMDASSQANRFVAMKQLFDATEATMVGAAPSPVTAATKACSVLIPSCPRTYLANKMQVIYAQDENTATGTMSVAKVMTAMVLLDFITDINRSVEMKSIDLVGGSGAFFSAGDMVSIKDLMYAMMLPSSNQAAHALGRIVGNEILKYGI